ncbi:MAG: hypothetical protein ABI883_01055 [Chthoniobacterales bacterium]
MSTEAGPAAHYRRFYKLLSDAQVEFILIGGCAANLHGSARFTLDVDVIYARGDTNLRRLIECLAPIHPYLRGAPEGLPFTFDFRTARGGLNFTFVTDWGSLDLLGEAAGYFYADLLPHAHFKDVDGLPVRTIDLEKLIELKRFAGRAKDHEVLAELEALRQDQIASAKQSPESA